MRGIFVSKKLIAVIICIIIAILFGRRENSSLGDAQSMLISKMLENEKVVEVFGMDEECIET